MFFMKTWLKGGLIAEIILLIGYLLLISIKGDQSIMVMILFFFGENPNSPLMFLGFAILYFAIGAAIGLIVQKLKSKK